MMIPYSNKPKITTQNLIEGFVNRYFVKNPSDKRIVEIDEQQYKFFSSNPYYESIVLPWTISGTDKNMRDQKTGQVVPGAITKNLQVIDYFEQKMPGLKRKLRNPLEYFNGRVIVSRSTTIVTTPQPSIPAPTSTPTPSLTPTLTPTPSLTATPTLTPTLTPTPTPTVTPSAPAIPYVTDNLLIHLDAGNPSSYPGSGTVWTDLTINGYNGTLVNGITYSSADGGTLVFDGSNDYVSISSLDLRRDFSLELWVKINAFSPSLQGLFGQGIAMGNQGMHIFLNASSVNYRMYFNDYNLGAVVNTSQWYQFIFTYSHSSYKKKIYRNGVLLGESAAQGQWQGDGPFRIGHTYSYISPSEKLNGSVGIFRAYSKVLSDTEALQNYDANKSRYGY